jgi:DNA repair exonuclease SbcCD nuclease subunit
MIKFLHAADIHLDSPLRGLEKYEGAPAERMRAATRRALENLVELALAEDVDFVLIAGDIYDGDWDDFNTGLFLCNRLDELGRAGIEVFLVSGNHDAASRITRSLTWPDNVHSFSTAAPETLVREDLGVAVHGQGYDNPAVQDNLAAGFPPACPGLFNIGLLHTSLAGYQQHEPYAPCSVQDLVDRGYDYWALGHVHERTLVREHEPVILFPGNTQGRHARETGPRGCTLVRVEEGGTVHAEHRDLDAARWEHVQVDAEGAAAPEDVLERFGEALESPLDAVGSRLLACRVRVAGVCPAHAALLRERERWQNEIRALATRRSAGRAWVEKVQLATRPEVDENALKQDGGAIGDLLAYLDLVEQDDDLLKDLAGELSDLNRKLPRALREGEQSLGLDRPETVRELLERCRRELMLHLVEESE